MRASFDHDMGKHVIAYIAEGPRTPRDPSRDIHATPEQCRERLAASVFRALEWVDR